MVLKGDFLIIFKQFRTVLISVVYALFTIGGKLLLLYMSKAPCKLWGCKNRAHFIFWPEIVKDIPNQGVQ